LIERATMLRYTYIVYRVLLLILVVPNVSRQQTRIIVSMATLNSYIVNSDMCNRAIKVEFLTAYSWQHF
jgi:hypothetical protein